MKILKKIGILYLGAIILTLVGYAIDKDPIVTDKTQLLLEFFIMSLIIFGGLSILFGIVYLIRYLYRKG